MIHGTKKSVENVGGCKIERRGVTTGFCGD
jgi:hypothetical protein